jgi:hypothetical protein
MGWTIRGVQTFIRFVQGAGTVSGATNVGSTDLFASRLAPTGVRRSNVGASLLAMASEQATAMCWPQCRRLRVSDGNSPNCLR